MSTKIILVRHAESLGNIELRVSGHTDFILSNNGIHQAKLLSRYLLKYKIYKVYSSPLKRALYTANIIAKEQNINNIIIKNDLIEIYLGIIDGWTWEKIDKYDYNIRKNWKELYNYPIMIPRQEKMEDCQNRINEAIEKIARENIDKTICIVGHGIAISSFLCRINNISLQHINRLKEQKNTAITILEYKDEQFEIVEEGLTEHLI